MTESVSVLLDEMAATLEVALEVTGLVLVPSENPRPRGVGFRIWRERRPDAQLLISTKLPRPGGLRRTGPVKRRETGKTRCA